MVPAASPGQCGHTPRWPGGRAMGGRRLRRGTLASLGCAAMLAVAVGAALAQSGPAVFINEIHYDNIGTDTGEAVEIAAPAGTDLGGWSLVRYNGATSTAAIVYTAPAATETLPAGTVVPDSCGGLG